MAVVKSARSPVPDRTSITSCNTVRALESGYGTYATGEIEGNGRDVGGVESVDDCAKVLCPDEDHQEMGLG